MLKQRTFFVKSFISSLIGLVLSVSVSAEPLIEGRVWLDSGEPVADAQVRIFDLSDLRQGAIARAQTDGSGYFALPLAALTGRVLPERFSLGQNYPNPFNPSTIIPYQLATSSEVRLEVFNLLGQHIATLVDGERAAGFHTATWRATDGAGRAVGAGVYIYRMMVEAESQTGRMVLIDGQAGVSAGGTASVMRGESGVGEPAEGVYGLIVSGNGLVPYVDSAFRVEAGMAPVELVVSAGQYSAGKVTDDDCPLCDFFDALNDMAEEESEKEEEDAPEEEEETDSTSNQGGPDLVVEPPLVMASGFVSPGATFTLLATVRNQGDSLATATTLRYYRSTDATISTRDTEVGTESVDALAAGGTSAKFIRLTTPSSEGIYYYGACVTSVAGESNTNNNCSSSRAVRVWSESSPVTIPDANLRAAIAAVLGKARGATITAAEIARMNRLVANNVGISDLTGLEFAVNLKWLYLSGNNISDVSTLSGLTNLRLLYLSGNNVSDVSALAGLTNLTELHLNDNPLSASSINEHIPALQNRGVTVEFDLGRITTDDPTPVTIPDANLRAAIEAALSKARGAAITKGEMTTLLTLDASEAGIRDLTGLELATNLTQLYLGDNNISDISALASLTNLTSLGLWDNNISDISALASLTNLTSLSLAGNNISDISALSGLTNLTWLSLSDNNISDISALASLTNLTFLGLRDNNISDISALASLTNLTDLGLSDNNISDISALASLTNLTGGLQLHGNNISDISPLASLTNLTGFLGLSSNNISDLSALSGLINLPSLYLGDNNISDISALASLTNLTFLRLEENNIRDISALASLTNLTFLGLDGNNISDISALVSLTNLKEVWLNRNLLGASFVYEHIPALQARGVTVEFDPVPSTITITITDDPTPVTIPDANLRAAIEATLGKARGAAITKGEMTTLLTLDASEAGISDLTGLEFATNLAFLQLSGNNISDLSALSGLTNLTQLDLDGNNISDLSALASLTSLTQLYLGDNNISDISALASLTSLTQLYLGDNNISDLSALASLTSLRLLRLRYNNLTDISALSGLTNLAWLDLLGNPLDASSINNHIPRLQDRRVDVQFNPNPFRGSEFDIELVFLGPFTDSEKNILRRAARQWMSVITEDLPDYEFTGSWSGNCGDQSYHIPSGERIDDLRIYVTSFDSGGAVGWGSPRLLREETHLPVFGCMAFDLKRANLWITGLHEIGHVLGFGVIWDDLGLLQNPNGDTHFNGPRAIAAFNDAGGRNYTGAKVPVESDLFHWKYTKLVGDLMVPGGGGALSAITVQSLADLGYGVNVTQADPFTLIDAAAKASAKIAAPATHIQPEWSCGTGQHQEPIYVVDPQGRIVRTISP